MTITSELCENHDHYNCNELLCTCSCHYHPTRLIVPSQIPLSIATEIEDLPSL